MKSEAVPDSGAPAPPINNFLQLHNAAAHNCRRPSTTSTMALTVAALLTLWLLAAPVAAAAASPPPPLLGRRLLVEPCEGSDAAQRWRITRQQNGSSSVIESLAHPGSCVNCPGPGKCHSWACAEGGGDPNGVFDIPNGSGSGAAGSSSSFTIRGVPPLTSSCVSVGLDGLLGRASPCVSGNNTNWRREAGALVLAARPTMCLTFGQSPPPAPGICPDGTDCTPAGGTCCKLKEPFGFGCARGGGSVCCDDQVHYCPAGHTCNFSKAKPPAGHTGAWGDIGAWGCDAKAGEEGAEERARALRLQGLPPPPAPVSIGGLDCFVQTGGSPRPWKTWTSSEPATRCAPGSPGDQTCSPYERSTDLQGLQFDGCDERDGGYGYSSFGQSDWDATFPKLDLQNGMPGADTWYPYWGADGRWYSSYTDGTVGGVHSQSGGSNPSMHGQVVMEPAGGQGMGAAGSPGNMKMVQAASFAVNSTPFEGNYPTGVFTSNATGSQLFYYGTYPVMGGNWSRWNEDCTNWCSLGPFPGWLWSDNSGASWHSSGHFPQGETRYGNGGTTKQDDFHAVGGVTYGGLFGECAGHEIGVSAGGTSFVDPCAVKFTYLRPVDYGQSNSGSPDGLLYFTSYGSSRPDGPVSWMSGDEAHLCRTDPAKGPRAMNNGSEYEFYAGETEDGSKAKWSCNIADAKPLFRWWNQTGITACTHFPHLKKMICVVETTCLHCGVSTQFDFDTYLLEADSPSGDFPPGSAFKLITYMESFGPEAYFVHIPSRFSPDNPDGTGFLAAAANFAEGSQLQAGGCGCSHCTVYGKCAMGGLLHPTGATYGMNLQKIRLCGPLLNISCESAPRTTLKEEAAWSPPTLADFEQAAAKLAQLHNAGSSATGTDTVPEPQQQGATIVDIGVDVVSNWPCAPPPAGYGNCVTATGHNCAPTLLGEWATLSNGSMALPSRPDFWTARLWNALVGSATFETKLTFFMPTPNSSIATLPPPCTVSSECVRVFGFRDRTNTSTILLLVNLDSNRSYVDAGESGRALHYLHRKEWQLTVPSLDSEAVSLNGKLLTAAQRKAGVVLPWTEPVSLAENAAKAALSLPPLSLTFMQLGLIPGDGSSAATAWKTDDDADNAATVVQVARSNVDPAHDDTGALLNAHETQIVQWTPGGIWYMYAMKYALCHAGPTGKGCAKNRTQCDFRQDHNVSVFTSKDLSDGSWHWVADLLPSAAPPAAYFRGKVLHNRLTEMFVLWIFGGENLVIATAKSPIGPFQLHSVEHSGGALLHKTGDLSFYIDSDETAFIIYNANMQGIAIEQLAPDYLSSLGRTNASKFSSAVFGAHATEAPVLFKKDETYYALFDRTCCVCSYGSGVGVWTATSALGNYTYRGQVGRDPETDTPVTHAQQCWVLQLPASSSPSHIWIGDRWGSASDGLHGHDMTYWQPLEFEADGSIRQFSWVDRFTISLAAHGPAPAALKSDDEDGSDASWCPRLHTIQGNDPSGPILANGTWHVFVTCTSSGNWQHYQSVDLMRWDVVAPTGFDPVTGSVGSTGGNHPLIAFWGNTSVPFPCCDIQASTPAQPADPNLTQWAPLGRAIARPASLSLHQGFRDPLRPLKIAGKWRIGVGSGSGADNTTPLQGAIHWFSAKDDGLLEWVPEGIFFAVPTTNGYVDPTTMAFNSSWNRTLNQIECPDVFELDGKVVVLASLQFDGPWQGTSTSFFVGSVDSTGTRFTAESSGLLDYGQLYAGRTGTSVAAAPGDRRVLFGFSGYPSPTQPKVCQTLPGAYHGMYHVFPRELSIKGDGRLNLSPVDELKTLHTLHQANGVAITGPSSRSLATGSQLDVTVSCEWGDTPPTTGQLSLSIFEDAQANESLLIGYDFAAQELFVDHALIGNATIRQTAPLARARLNGSSSDILRILTDNSMVESFSSSAVAITSFVSPSGPTPPADRQLRVAAVPKGVACTLDVFSISLKTEDDETTTK